MAPPTPVAFTYSGWAAHSALANDKVLVVVLSHDFPCWGLGWGLDSGQVLAHYAALELQVALMSGYCTNEGGWELLSGDCVQRPAAPSRSSRGEPAAANRPRPPGRRARPAELSDATGAVRKGFSFFTNHCFWPFRVSRRAPRIQKITKRHTPYSGS